ncbi:MAG: futalosine hydrolase [Gemmatimonadaceae bacterium]|nr:futalosine hydrolase [Chitinophagaceae bacterium]
MYVLIAAATKMEVQPTLNYLEKLNFLINDKKIEMLTTGVGGISTAYFLTSQIEDRRPDLIIQAGLAGSFHDSIPLGAVVSVATDVTGDMGAQEGDDFKDMFDLGLQEESTMPFSARKLVNVNLSSRWPHLPAVNAVSVNEITTSPERIELLKKKYGAEIESMEGAAFHYVCLQMRIEFLQLRAISNMVGERDKSKWEISAAISSLNSELIKCLNLL